MTWGTKPTKPEEEEAEDTKSAWPDQPELECKVAKEEDEEDERYTTCCFHVKSITYIFGVIELIIIAIIILLLGCALIRSGKTRNYIDGIPVDHDEYKNRSTSPQPDPTEKKNQAKPYDEKEIGEKEMDEPWLPKDEVIFFIERRPIKCRKTGKVRSRHHHRTSHRYFAYLMGHQVNQEIVLASLLWFSVCAGAVGVMLHGLMKRKWSRMIPYLALRGVGLSVNIIALIIVLVLAIRHPVHPTRVTCKFFWGSLITLLNGYSFHVAKRCCQFVADKGMVEQEKEKSNKVADMA